MTEKNVNIAVIGCGHWGKHHVRNFRDLGVLKMVCDLSAQGQELAKTLAPDCEVVGTLESVWDNEAIDAVVIATLAETHHFITLNALEHGKHVLVEKPIALNYRDAIEMHECALQAERILMVGHLLEYHPGVLAMRQMIADGVLGKLNYIYSNRLAFGKIRTQENALWSFAPHDIALMLRLVGDLPIEVTCAGGNYITPNLADVTVSCLHFPNGVRGHVFVSWLNPFKEQKLVVIGDKKMVVFNDISQNEKLVLYDQHVEIENSQPILQKDAAEEIALPEEEPLRNECIHFLECIVENKQPLSDANSAINVLKILQACQISLQLNGRPTVLSSL